VIRERRKKYREDAEIWPKHRAVHLFSVRLIMGPLKNRCRGKELAPRALNQDVVGEIRLLRREGGSERQ
jgi:hypothetical protein